MPSVPPVSAIEPGYRLDRYELLCKVGQGGMAIVWLARQQGKHGFEKLVAIKTVLPEHASDLGFRNALLEEARLASAIDHPNVARIIDVGEDRELPFLVMEYIGGESLNRLRKTLARKSELVPPRIVLRVLADTCAGLHAAHELRDPQGNPLGLVHRDVSPQNILCSEKGAAKLIDFGVAKAAGRLATETATGIIKGKVPYMAPEQAMGPSVDRRADIWSIGSVAYSLLANAYPFDGANDAQRLVRALSGQPPPPLPASVPQPVADVVLRALAFDVDERFQTADEMRLAIERAMAESGIVTTHDDVARFFTENLVESAHRRKTMVDTALAAAAERERMREVLDPPPSSMTDLGSGPRSTSDLSGPRQLSLPDTPPSFRTLGPAVAPVEPTPPPKRSATTLILAGVGAAVVVVGLVVAAFVIGSMTSSKRGAANTTTPSASIAAMPSATPSATADPSASTSALASASSAEPDPVVPVAASSSATKPGSKRVPAKRNPTNTTTKKRDDDTIF